MKIISIILPRAAVVAALAIAPLAQAANPENVTVNANVPTIANLAVNTNTVTMTFVSGDFNMNTGEALKTVSGGSNFQIATNRNWTLSVKSGAASFTFTPTFGGDTATKPAADLGFKLSSGGAYQSLTTTDQTVSTGSRGGYGVSGNSPSVDYSLWSYLNQDAPGAYSLTLVYTLTSS
jgi:hypothetical protein